MTFFPLRSGDSLSKDVALPNALHKVFIKQHVSCQYEKKYEKNNGVKKPLQTDKSEIKIYPYILKFFNFISSPATNITVKVSCRLSPETDMSRRLACGPACFNAAPEYPAQTTYLHLRVFLGFVRQLEFTKECCMDEKRILIVDDDKVFLKMLKKTLTSSGYKVAKATNGKDAIDIAKNWRPHLIILDIMMPEMDGGEAALALEKDPATENIPIIFMTSLLEKGEESKMVSTEKRSYMSKPYDTDGLLAEIARKL